MKKIFSKFAALAAMIGMISSPTIPTQAQQQTSQNQQKKQELPPLQTAKPNEVIRELDGGFQIHEQLDYGIPPIIYGTYHVKKGTHKKTNKKLK